VSSQGSPYARFTRALRTGNLALVRAAAGELPHVRLDDALLIACLIEEHDRDRFERAAVRWLGRFALERPSVRIEDLREGAVAFAALAANPDGARRALEDLCTRHGVRVAL
jgi:hypothetical protein